jgi:hypothetical protein
MIEVLNLKKFTNQMSIIKISPAKHVKSSEDDYLKGGYGDEVQWRLAKKNCDPIIYSSLPIFSMNHTIN